MIAKASRAALLAAFSVALIVSTGCVDNDPIVSGHRPDGGTSDSGPTIAAITTVEAGTDDPDVDDPKCRHCAETLDTDKPRGLLCRHNDGGGGLSSVLILNNLVDCVCYDKCAAKCGNYCSGGKTDLFCTACITQSCPDQIGACNADLGN